MTYGALQNGTHYRKSLDTGSCIMPHQRPQITRSNSRQHLSSDMVTSDHRFGKVQLQDQVNAVKYLFFSHYIGNYTWLQGSCTWKRWFHSVFRDFHKFKIFHIFARQGVLFTTFTILKTLTMDSFFYTATSISCNFMETTGMARHRDLTGIVLVYSYRMGLRRK